MCGGASAESCQALPFNIHASHRTNEVRMSAFKYYAPASNCTLLMQRGQVVWLFRVNTKVVAVRQPAAPGWLTATTLVFTQPNLGLFNKSMFDRLMIVRVNEM